MKRVFMQIYTKGSAEAIELYKEAFDAVLGYHEKHPDGTYMHTELDICGHVIAVGEDIDGSNQRVTGNTMQFCLHFGDGEEDKVLKAYAVLKEGGKINVPLGPCIFSPCMTDVIDRFGVRWCLFV